MTKRRTPKYLYLALDAHGDVVGSNTNLAELRDEVSADWTIILRYSGPRIIAERNDRR